MWLSLVRSYPVLRFLAFILGWWVYRPYSYFIALVLRMKGIRVGRRFRIQGVPQLKIRGRPQDIIIGDDVTINGNVDFRNRETGRIVIGDGVTLDTNSRFIAANDAVLHVADHCRVGCYCIFNCGADVVIGQGTLIAGFCYIQSSNHGIRKGTPIKDQPHTYGKIEIGSNAWLGGHVTVLPGCKIGNGAVVGSKSVVTKDIPDDAIYGGVPAAQLGVRA